MEKVSVENSTFLAEDLVRFYGKLVPQQVKIFDLN